MSQNPTMFRISLADWLNEAEARFGKSLRKMRVTCPACKFEQSGQDFLNLGVSAEEVATLIGFSCIGRKQKKCRDALTQSGPGPCNYTNGGLIRLGPICIQLTDGKEIYVFDFADGPLAALAQATA